MICVVSCDTSSTNQTACKPYAERVISFACIDSNTRLYSTAPSRTQYSPAGTHRHATDQSRCCTAVWSSTQYTTGSAPRVPQYKQPQQRADLRAASATTPQDTWMLSCGMCASNSKLSGGPQYVNTDVLYTLSRRTVHSPSLMATYRHIVYSALQARLQAFRLLVSVPCTGFCSCPERFPVERCYSRQTLLRIAFAASCSSQRACSCQRDSELNSVASTTVLVRPFTDVLPGWETKVAS